MHLSFLYSILLHLFLAIFIMFSFDYSRKHLPQEETILLELIPIDLVTNIKTTTSNKTWDKNKPMESQEKTEEVKITSSKSEFTPAITEPVKEPPIKEPIKEPVKTIEKKPDIKPPTDKDISNDTKEKLPTNKKILPKEQKEPSQQLKNTSTPPKKLDKKIDKKKADPDTELANKVLKSLQEGGKEKSKQKQNLKDLMENAIKGDTTEDYNDAGDLSMSEVALIRSQISRAWRVGAFSGGKDNRQFRVVTRITLEADGTVKDIKLENKSSKDVQSRVYNAFVDSVLRAIRLASPLQGLPSDKFETWEEMELVFDSSGMIY